MQKLPSTKNTYLKSKREIQVPESNTKTRADSPDNDDPLQPQRKLKIKKPIKKFLESNGSDRKTMSEEKARSDDQLPCFIELYSHFKSSSDFCLLDKHDRETIVEDLFEFDKSFYLNYHNLEIYKDLQSKLNRRKRDKGVNGQVY